MAKSFTEIEMPRKASKTGFLLIEVFDTDEAWKCQHFISNRMHCTENADETCAFCGAWTCHKHFDHSRRVTIEGNGLTLPYKVSPCTSCATLSTEDSLRLRALRLELNR